MDSTPYIIVRIDRHYGVERIYPVCEVAKKFLQLTGRRCFSEKDLDTIASLGYTVAQETPQNLREAVGK